MEIRDQVEQEAIEANRASASLNDEAVAAALGEAAALVRERSAAVLAANEADCEAAAGRLDEGTLDRLRLGAARVETAAPFRRATWGPSR